MARDDGAAGEPPAIDTWPEHAIEGARLGPNEKGGRR